jgi:rhodanese-related sulfurtransferase
LWPLIKGGGSSTALSPLEATQLINHRNAIVVDLRAEKDFALGSLAGARNIPNAVLADRAAELVRFKARPLLIICDAGQQSTRAIATFKAQGFTEAFSLAGGIAAWKQASLPLVQGGRDNTRVAAKDTNRKGRNDNRSRSSKTTPVVVADTAANDDAKTVIVEPAIEGAAVDESSSATRVKELS